MNFSDHKIIVASTTGTVGMVDTTYKVRDIGPSGGYVFYVNPNYLSDGWRFLEAAPTRWNKTPADPYYLFGHYRDPVYNINQIVGTITAVGTGEANTLALTTKMGNTVYTAEGTVISIQYFRQSRFLTFTTDGTFTTVVKVHEIVKN